MRRIASRRRQRRTAPWSPLVRTAGTPRPSNVGRAGVLRVLEESVGERLLDGRGLVDRAGQEPQDRVDDDQCRQLAAGQHVVADRQLQVDERPDALVDALVTRAEQDEVAPAGQLEGARLAERLAGGLEQDHGRIAPSKFRQGCCDGLGPDDHPGAAAVRLVVDRAMPTEPPAPQIVDPDLGQPALQDAGRDARGERSLQHRREERHDVDLEGHRRSVLGHRLGARTGRFGDGLGLCGT